MRSSSSIGRPSRAISLIYVNLNLVPMDGGHKSVAVGFCGYKSLKAHHNPQTMRKCHSYMDPKSSALATSASSAWASSPNKKLNVFTIETTINNRMFDRPLEFLHKNEDDLSGMEKTALEGAHHDALEGAAGRAPGDLPEACLHRTASPASSPARPRPCTSTRSRARYEQYLVPIKGQADILVTGVPYISPYNVNSFLNPLLVQVMVNGYLFNMYKGVPLLKKGGTMIVTHPCTDMFDKEHHAPYIEFVHNLLPETRDALELHKRYEAKFASNPAYIQAYRTGHAYHPAHPFFMWYWGEAGRQHTGRVIVVGADNEYIPKLMGWETARTMNEALEMAKDTAPPSPDIVLMHMPADRDGRGDGVAPAACAGAHAPDAVDTRGFARDAQLEASASRGVDEPQRSAERALREVARDREAEARPVLRSLRREERVEDARAVSGRDPRAVVLHDERDRVPGARRGDLDSGPSERPCRRRARCGPGS